MRIITSLVTAALLTLTPLINAGEILIRNGESVAFLGDSITAQGAGSAGGYVRLFASGLAAEGVNITVIPAGVSGNKSDQMLARLEKDVLSKKPTWMTLSCGVNDVWHGANGIPLEAYKKNITEILDRCEKAGVKVIILTATQIKLPITNAENTKLADYNVFLRDMAKERKLPVADLNAAMAAEQSALEKAGIKRVLTTDGVHMNIYGNLMMAKTALKAVGLDDRQLATVQTKWSEIPDLYQGNVKVGLTLKELAALETYAASKGKTADAVLNEAATKAVKEQVKSAAK